MSVKEQCRWLISAAGIFLRLFKRSTFKMKGSQFFSLLKVHLDLRPAKSPAEARPFTDP